MDQIMLRLITLLATTIFFLPNSSADTYIKCDSCSAKERVFAAHRVIDFESSPQDGAEPGKQETIHVVDMANMDISSYDWSLEDYESPQDGNWILRSFRKVSTPSTISSPMKQLRKDVAELNKKAENSVIPISVIQDPWEFVNCAYCENSVEAFINNNLEGKILTVSSTIKSVAQIFGFMSTGVPNQFRSQIEAGGYLEVKMVLARGPYLIIDVTKVVDKSGNTVPFKKESLDGLRVRISDVDSARTINSYISGLSFSVPFNTGSVTITDCDIDANDPDKENAPCG